MRAGGRAGTWGGGKERLGTGGGGEVETPAWRVRDPSVGAEDARTSPSGLPFYFRDVSWRLRFFAIKFLFIFKNINCQTLGIA